MTPSPRAALLMLCAIGCGPSVTSAGAADRPVVSTDVVPEPAPRASTLAPDPVYDAVADPERLLAHGFAERELRRAHLKRAGAVYWDLEAARAGRADLPARPDRQVTILDSEVVVAERHPRHLRVVRSGRGVLATFYLSTEDFHDVSVRRATLLDRGGEPFADGCGVTIPPGTQLEARPVEVEFRRVAYRRYWIAAEGVLAEGDVGIVFRAGGEDDSGNADERDAPCEIRAPFTLRDGPSGQVVAELLGDELRFCTLRGPERRGARRIEVSHHGARVVGYAPAAQVILPEPDGLGTIGTIGHGGGSGWGASHTEYLYLSPGDAIFASRDDLRIATVTATDLRVGDEGEHDGWHRVRLPFQLWGFEVFHITPATAQAAGKSR